MAKHLLDVLLVFVMVILPIINFLLLLKIQEKKEEIIDYYNNKRIKGKLKGMSPVQYRVHSQAT